MNIQRLKYAYARGARIQVRAFGYVPPGKKENWATLRLVPIWDRDSVYRIHPKDQHLEYGPLSSAMRSVGIHGIEGLTPLTADAYQVYQHITGGLHPTYYAEDCGAADPKEVGRMHALFIAELLADEGL